MNSKINSLLHGEMENYIFPFFWQHGESEAVLRKYMQVIYDANIRAVCIESRPHPDFVGAGWWRDMDIILEEARKRKMRSGYWMTVISPQDIVTEKLRKNRTPARDGS